jgi:hypothetical protein
VHELLASEIEMRGLHFTMLDLTKEVGIARTSIVKYTQELEVSGVQWRFLSFVFSSWNPHTDTLNVYNMIRNFERISERLKL